MATSRWWRLSNFNQRSRGAAKLTCRRSSVRWSSVVGGWSLMLLRPPPSEGTGSWDGTPAACPGSVYRAGPQGFLRGPSPPAMFHKCVFYLHGSIFLEESKRRACTGAPVMWAIGPFIFQPPFFLCVSPAREAIIFGPPGSRSGLVGPARFRGAQLGRPGAASEIPRRGLRGRPGRHHGSKSILIRRRESTF